MRKLPNHGVTTCEWPNSFPLQPHECDSIRNNRYVCREHTCHIMLCSWCVNVMSQQNVLMYFEPCIPGRWFLRSTSALTSHNNSTWWTPHPVISYSNALSFHTIIVHFFFHYGRFSWGIFYCLIKEFTETYTEEVPRRTWNLRSIKRLDLATKARSNLQESKVHRTSSLPAAHMMSATSFYVQVVRQKLVVLSGLISGLGTFGPTVFVLIGLD